MAVRGYYLRVQEGLPRKGIFKQKPDRKGMSQIDSRGRTLWAEGTTYAKVLRKR